MQITRRTLLEGRLLRLQHIVVRPSSSGTQDLQRQDCNVLVLPLAGVFTKHDGPRAQVTGTPAHAVFIQADKPYRLSLPGGLGDESLSIRYPAEVLPAPAASHRLLSPELMLARSLLWRELRAGAWDPLEVEEVALDLLHAVIDQPSAHGEQKAATARPKRIEAVKETISLAPERNWTLDELASVACVSPWHLTRVFRSQVGESVHRYVLRARLAKALDAVLDGGSDLTAIALDAGFSSHSHFTARFRALFGATPTEVRQSANGGTARQLRKIVTARPRVQH